MRKDKLVAKAERDDLKARSRNQVEQFLKNIETSYDFDKIQFGGAKKIEEKLSDPHNSKKQDVLKLFSETISSISRVIRNELFKAVPTEEKKTKPVELINSAFKWVSESIQGVSTV